MDSVLGYRSLRRELEGVVKKKRRHTISKQGHVVRCEIGSIANEKWGSREKKKLSRKNISQTIIPDVAAMRHLSKDCLSSHRYEKKKRTGEVQ